MPKFLVVSYGSYLGQNNLKLLPLFSSCTNHLQYIFRGSKMHSLGGAEMDDDEKARVYWHPFNGHCRSFWVHARLDTYWTLYVRWSCAKNLWMVQICHKSRSISFLYKLSKQFKAATPVFITCQSYAKVLIQGVIRWAAEMDGDEKTRVYWHPVTAIVAHFEFTPGLTKIGHSMRGEVAPKIYGWSSANLLPQIVTKLGQLQIWIGVNILAQQTWMEGGRLTWKLNLQDLFFSVCWTVCHLYLILPYFLISNSCCHKMIWLDLSLYADDENVYSYSIIYVRHTQE